jgi:hypothetical protein
VHFWNSPGFDTGKCNPRQADAPTRLLWPVRAVYRRWNAAEIEQLKQLVKLEGPGKWEEKATKLGTGRTAKSLHTRWLRDEGRIIDRPRTVASASSRTPTVASLV